MAKFKKDDFVVWRGRDRLSYPIYCTVDTVINPPAIDEPYYICFIERTALVMLGATSPMVKRLIEYSADVIDLYKKEENE